MLNYLGYKKEVKNMMKYFENYKARMTMLDHSLVKMSCVASGIFLAALIPQLLNINMWYWLGFVLIFAIKPWHTALKK